MKYLTFIGMILNLNAFAIETSVKLKADFILDRCVLTSDSKTCGLVEEASIHEIVTLAIKECPYTVNGDLLCYGSWEKSITTPEGINFTASIGVMTRANKTATGYTAPTYRFTSTLKSNVGKQNDLAFDSDLNFLMNAYTYALPEVEDKTTNVTYMPIMTVGPAN